MLHALIETIKLIMVVAIGGIVAAPVVLGGAAAGGAAAGATAAAASATATGAATTGAAAAAAGGAAVGGTATAAAGGAAAAATGGTAAAVLSGPIGWALLGATSKTSSNVEEYSWDCWKPLLHNKSEEKSKGRLLKDILCDKRILSVISSGLSSGDASKCSFIVKNIWNETFDIKPVILYNGIVAFHATKQN